MKGNIVRIGPKTKGYGFILGEDGNDYFLHIMVLCQDLVQVKIRNFSLF